MLHKVEDRFRVIWVLGDGPNHPNYGPDEWTLYLDRRCKLHGWTEDGVARSTGGVWRAEELSCRGGPWGGTVSLRSHWKRQGRTRMGCSREEAGWGVQVVKHSRSGHVGSERERDFLERNVSFIWVVSCDLWKSLTLSCGGINKT